MSRKSMRLAAAAGALALVCTATGIAEAAPAGNGQGRNDGRHVLLISIDGMHQADLAWYIKQHPNSTLAALAGDGDQYTGAQTTNPSDSFPGMVAQFTGATAGQSGVYYDDTFNYDLLPAGRHHRLRPHPEGRRGRDDRGDGQEPELHRRRSGPAGSAGGHSRHDR
ncbi:alkaline phosphatase family protein [Nocardia niigatensis]